MAGLGLSIGKERVAVTAAAYPHIKKILRGKSLPAQAFPSKAHRVKADSALILPQMSDQTGIGKKLPTHLIAAVTKPHPGGDSKRRQIIGEVIEYTACG
jgi:hypothetical protein